MKKYWPWKDGLCDRYRSEPITINRIIGSDLDGEALMQQGLKWPTIVLVLITTASAHGQGQEAVDRIERVGGEAFFDERKPKKPIFEVKLQGDGITDKELALVEDLVTVRTLFLNLSRI